MNTQVRQGETLLPLAAWIASRGEFGHDELRGFLQQLALQVLALHDQGVLHGNLVPVAIGMNADGHPQLTSAAGELSDLLELDPELAPPEVRRQRTEKLPRNLAAASHALSQPGAAFDARRIDVYQLGALVVQVAAGVSVDDYIRSPLAAAKIPTALRRVVDRALGSSPAQRLTTCTQLLEELELATASAETPPTAERAPAREVPARETPSRGVAISSDTDLIKKQREQARRKHETGKLPFDHLGGYEIVARLGSGGMGDVFKGYDASLDRFVAIKVLPLEFARQEDFVGRFRAEAAAAAKVEHPNIVPIYTIGSDQDRHFFAMQFVDGQTLGQLLAEQPRLATEKALRIVEQVVSGLAAAHRFGLVHRDIKPGNILLADGGKRALVADFGLVKSIGQDNRMTATGVVMGTVDYISPEQGRGKSVDGRSDLYSVGVMLYQMLAGRLPFSADTPTAMIFQHAYEPPPPLVETAPQVPPVLTQIVHRLLAKAPGERYQTCEDLLDDLAAFRAGETPPHLSGAAASRETGPRTAIILAPKFAEHELSPKPEPTLAQTSRWSWEHAKQYVFFWLKQKSPELVRHLENTQQQVAGAVFEYEQRCNSLGRLVSEAGAVQRLLEIQLREYTAAASMARQRQAIAPNDEALDEAQAASAANEAAAAQLHQQIAQQREELEAMQLEYAKASARLTRLKSQRDALNARLQVAQAKYSLSDARKRTWPFKVKIGLAGAAAITGIVLVVIYSRLPRSVPPTPSPVAQEPRKEPRKEPQKEPEKANEGVTMTLALDASRQQTVLPSLPTFIQFTGEKFDRFADFVVGSEDGRLLEMRLNEGKIHKFARRIGSHGGPVRYMGWSRATSHLASASPDGDIWIWTFPQGKLYRQLAQGSEAKGLAFSSNGSQLLAGGQNEVRLWDVVSGIELQRYQEPRFRAPASSLAWLPDGSGFVQGGRISGAPSTYVVNMAGNTWTPMRVSVPVTDIAVINGGRGIIGVVSDCLHTWNAEDGTELLSFGAGVTCAAYSEQARRALTGHRDGKVTLWDTATGQSVQEFKMQGRVQAVGISNRSLFGAAASGQEIRALVLPREPVPFLKGRFVSSTQIRAIAISPTQFSAISVSDQQVRAINLEDESSVSEISGTGPSSAVAIAPDGDRFLLARSQPDRQGFGTIVLRNQAFRTAPGDPVLRRYQGHKGGTNAALFVRNATRIVSGGNDNYLREWETSTEQELENIDVGVAVRGLAAPADGLQVAVVGDGSITCDIWSLESKQRLGVLEGHSLAPRSVVWARNAPRVATASGDRTARVWDPQTFTSIVTFEHPSPVTVVDITGDGKWLITGSQDGYLRVWDVEAKKAVRAWWAHESAITAMTFATDGRSAVSAGADQMIYWWDLPLK